MITTDPTGHRPPSGPPPSTSLSPTAAGQPRRRVTTAPSDYGATAPAPNSVLEIANAIVHLYKDAFGRGPTKSRAIFLGPDTLVVLLEDMLTAPERQLVELGEHVRVREQRLFLQLALEDSKRSEIERILTRRVLSCVSGTDPGRDLAAELFLLEPGPPDV